MGAASNARTVDIELRAASETLFPLASCLRKVNPCTMKCWLWNTCVTRGQIMAHTLVCMTLVKLRINCPYHLDKTVMAGTEMKARMDNCHDTMNIKIKTPMACTNERKNTLTLRVT